MAAPLLPRPLAKVQNPMSTPHWLSSMPALPCAGCAGVSTAPDCMQKPSSEPLDDICRCCSLPLDTCFSLVQVAGCTSLNDRMLRGYKMRRHMSTFRMGAMTTEPGQHEAVRRKETKSFGSKSCMGLERVCTISGCASYDDGNDQITADSCNDKYLGGRIVVEAAAAVHDALAVVLPHAGAVQRLVVSEVGIRDITCTAHIYSQTHAWRSIWLHM